MIQSNYHIHSTYCDGKDSLEAMTLAAIASGLTSIGFTSHMPLPYKNDWTMIENDVESYISDVKMLVNTHKENIDIYLGMEIDYFIDSKDISSFAKKVIPKLDFFIGSIHTIGQMKNGVVADIDYTADVFKNGIEDCYNGSAKAFVKAYYGALGDMALKIHPDIIGHIDLVKKNNEDHIFFDENEDWYREAASNCLDKIKKAGSIIEINTGGMIRYGARCLYPSKWLMKEIVERHIPIVLNGDSHSIEGIKYEYTQVESILKNIGFTEVMIREKDRWKPIAF